MMRKTSVTIPATTANLGPGFDCLGLALALHNEVTMTPLAAPGLSLAITGTGANQLSTGPDNLVVRAAERVFAAVGKRPSGLRLQLHNGIPLGGGLGSSAAAILGGMLAANGVVNGRLSPDALFQMALDLEGHPDNLAPALYGGLTLSLNTAAGWHVETLLTPPLRVVIVFPSFSLPTVASRAALPAQVAHADAVFNAAHLALLVQALTAADYDKLAMAMADRLHQPYRMPLVPGIAAAMDAARAAGAAGVALSGAGPSLVAFAAEGHRAIGDAAQAAFAEAGLASRSWVLAVDGSGARVKIEPSPPAR